MSSLWSPSRAPPIWRAETRSHADRSRLRSQNVGAGLRDRLVIVGDAGDPDAAHAFVAMEQRNAARDRKAVREHQPSRPLLDPLLQGGTRPLAEGGGARLERGDLDTVRRLPVG